MPPQQPALNPFNAFALTCSHIASNSSKLEKVRLLAEYLRGLKGNAIGIAATWFSGRPFPATQNKVLQLGWAVLRDALCSVGRMDAAAFNQVYLKHSDLGETASEVLQKNAAAPSLSVEQVDDLFQKIQAARGPLAKTPLLAAVLASCTPMEAKYLVKIITGDLRIGLKEGLVEDAVASAFSQGRNLNPGAPASLPAANDVRQANLLLGDIGETAKLAAENRLSEATLVPFRPIKFMLASPEETATDVWDRMQPTTAAQPSSPSPPPGEERVGERRPSARPPTDPIGPSSREHSVSASSPSPPEERAGERRPFTPAPQPTPSVWLEDKYDGIRCQLHKVGQRVALYSRDLKEITSTFFELADSARTVTADFILDGEIIAMRKDEILPFAQLQKRLGRREDDLFMSSEVPVKFVAFDLLWLDGQSYLDRPLRERRQRLEKLGPLSEFFRFAQITQATSAEQIYAAFDAARSRQNEGLMIKNPESVYAPGRRGLAWLKLKQAFATLDCVVIGAEYGHGKRNKVLSDYTFAVRDEETGELKTIGKAYSGLTDVEIAGLTEHFLKRARRQRGRYFEVEPDTVLEIAFDKLQRSDRHTSGLAMRFPRIVRIRTDKSVAEIDTLASARRLAV
jgi:DNA ligase-1